MELKRVPAIPNEIITGGFSAVLLYIGARYLLPLFISRISAEKAVNSISESLLRQIAQQLEEAHRLRKDESERADKMFLKWSEAENKVSLLTMQLDHANSRISELNTRLDRLENELNKSSS